MRGHWDSRQVSPGNAGFLFPRKPRLLYRTHVFFVFFICHWVDCACGLHGHFFYFLFYLVPNSNRRRSLNLSTQRPLNPCQSLGQAWFIENKFKQNRQDQQHHSGNCRAKSLCNYLHPKDHCKNDKCTDKECPNRHIKPCKNCLKNSCQFDKTCEFRHDAKNIQNLPESKENDLIINKNIKDVDNLNLNFLVINVF